LATYCSSFGGFIGTVSNDPFSLYVNSGNASLTVDTNGRVGIGTTTPTSQLEVQAKGAATIGVFATGTGKGVFGQSVDGTGTYGSATGAGGTGVTGSHFATTGTAPGVQGTTYSTSDGAAAVYGEVVSTAPGVGSAALVGINRGSGTNGYGIIGTHAGAGWGIYGQSPTGQGVHGESGGGTGVYGSSNGGSGVYGSGGPSGKGVYGSGLYGVYGETSTGDAVHGEATGTAYAGDFRGTTNVVGQLYADKLTVFGSKNFKIDHPLDPANKYLVHSCIESPDRMNIYNGNVTTDVEGDAIVELPSYFSALNVNFRYQLTVIGQFAQAIVAKEIDGNQFIIKTDKPNVKVSWQVTGVRQDAYARAHPMVVEEEKSPEERDAYRFPELYGQPPEKGTQARREARIKAAMSLPQIESSTIQAPSTPAATSGIIPRGK
jgi:hypothetical protein